LIISTWLVGVAEQNLSGGGSNSLRVTYTNVDMSAKRMNVRGR
jgi:hypothetical protein